VRRQIRHNPGILTGAVEPDYKACIKISTRSSLIEMIPAGALVIFWCNIGDFKSIGVGVFLRTGHSCWVSSGSLGEWGADGDIGC
jgi:Na+/H+-translocating membrane pyrophosphatase